MLVRENVWSYTREWPGSYELTLMAVAWQRPIIVFETKFDRIIVHQNHPTEPEDFVEVTEQNMTRLNQRVDFLDLPQQGEPIYLPYVHR